MAESNNKYKVPFVNFPAHYQTMKDEYHRVIDGVLSKGNLLLREELEEFEKRFSSFNGVAYGVGVNSGFDSLHLSLRALELDRGDEVITVSHTCIATVSAIVNAGAVPVLIDIREDFNMDPARIEASITPRTKAIVPVHLNGRACDMAAIMNIAEKHGLAVVEDAAQAIGATFNGKMVGSFGRIGCVSFYPFKMLGALGDGGMVLTNDEEIARRVAALRDYGWERNGKERRVRYFGFNARLDNLQAAVVNMKLDYLPGWIVRRQEIAARYTQGLSDIQELQLPSYADTRFSDVYLNYVIRSQEQDALVAYVEERGVEVLISLSHSVHHYDILGFGDLSLPETDRASHELICLPIYPELTDQQIDYVIEHIGGFYKR